MSINENLLGLKTQIREYLEYKGMMTPYEKETILKDIENKISGIFTEIEYMPKMEELILEHERKFHQ